MDVHDTPARDLSAATAGAAPPLARRWLRPVVAVGIGVAALVGTGTGTANTGGRSNRALALTALALLIVGAGLAWSAMIRRNRNGAS